MPLALSRSSNCCWVLWACSCHPPTPTANSQTSLEAHSVLGPRTQTPKEPCPGGAQGWRAWFPHPLTPFPPQLLPPGCWGVCPVLPQDWGRERGVAGPVCIPGLSGALAHPCRCPSRLGTWPTVIAGIPLSSLIVLQGPGCRDKVDSDLDRSI